MPQAASIGLFIGPLALRFEEAGAPQQFLTSNSVAQTFGQPPEYPAHLPDTSFVASVVQARDIKRLNRAADSRNQAVFFRGCKTAAENPRSASAQQA